MVNKRFQGLFISAGMKSDKYLDPVKHGGLINVPKGENLSLFDKKKLDSEFDPIKLNYANVYLRDILDDVSDSFIKKATSMEIEWELEVDFGLPEIIRMDEELFREMLKVLISDVFKSSPKGEKVVLKVEVGAMALHFRISRALSYMKNAP